MTTDNFQKHTTKNPLQKFLINKSLNVLAKELEKISPQSILDAGCGEGFTLDRIKKLKIGKTLEGIDFKNEAINLGRIIHPEIELKHGNIYQLAYPEESFDVVICTEVLEHLEYPEKAMQEIQRVAKNYCIIMVPNEPLFRIINFLRGKNITRWGNDIEHIQHWSVRGISNLIGKYFTVKTVKTSFPWTLVVGEK